MWSKGLNRSRGMGNPTSGDNNSAHVDSMRIEPISKDLPSLPEGSDDENNTPTRASEASATAKDGKEWRYSAVSPMASPTLETVNDSGSSFCVSPIDESNGFPRQEQRASTGEYFADAHLHALYVDTPPSPTAAPTPPRKKKAVAFVAEPEQIPSAIENYSPAEPPQQTLEAGPGAPIRRDFEYHNDSQESIPEESFHEPTFRSFSPPPVSKDLPVKAPSEHPSGARRHVHSGEPSTMTAGKAGQANPQNNTSHKSTGSASNLLSWGREQLLPIKEFAQARSRSGSFYKSEIPVPIRGKDKRLKDGGHRSTLRVAPSEVHSKRPSANTGVQLSHIGLVPTTVTTITAGSPKTLPKKPTPRDAPTKQWREQRDIKPLPEINTVIDTLLPTQPLVDFGGSIAVPKPDSPSPRESPRDSPRDSPRESPRESSRESPRESPQPDSSGTPEAVDDNPSIMSRRRPIPITMPVSRKPIRKPTPAEAAPGPDPVAQAPTDPVDRIQALEAKRDGLARRRVNLETVIKELTRVIQPNNVAYDLAAKQEVKRSVQSIENDIAEIKREEHELGLKAARAWRRLDENNNGNGSTLWVKRVTS
ncbi:hypothetical protein N7494_006430 [Penicillium frequentans]|uniref:BHLH domain-containing protein n=1 Tax=Penicillium frequentans TaxID=3151616 RepID=A0AAD6CWL8_9EURO|nr:hypothetical protein N7494_006430 [Penicillium glabrum]